MNKKGFTLIEIIAVLVIIGLLLVLVLPNILANLNAAKGKVSEATKRVLEEATNLYLDQSPDAEETMNCITVETLINAGLLVEPVLDAETGDEIDQTVAVRVDITDKGRELEVSEDGTCAGGAGEEYVPLKSTDISLDLSNATTKGFTATTEITKTGENIPKIIRYDYSIDDGKTYDYKGEENKNGSLTDTRRITNLITDEYKVRVRVITEEGQVLVSEGKRIKLAPIEAISFKSNPSMNVCAEEKTVTITFPDTSSIAQSVTPPDTLSYSYTIDPSLDKSRWEPLSTGGKEDDEKISYDVKVRENGVMVARATDGVNERTATFALTKVESINPIVLSTTVDYEGELYYAGKVTVRGRVSACKQEENIKISAYCLTTTTSSASCDWQEEKTFGRDNGTYYAFVKDSENNVSKPYKVIVNWPLTPSCNISVSGTMGNNNWYTSNIAATIKVNTANKIERGRSLTPSTVTSDGKTTIVGSISSGGKTGYCTYAVQKDSTNPTCTVSSYETNVATPSATFACTDATSGCISSGTTKTASSSTTLSYTCEDYAGNKSSASKAVVKYVEPEPEPEPEYTPPSSGGSSGSSSGGSSGGSSSTDSFSYTCGCDAKMTVTRGWVHIVVKSATGPSAVTYSGSCSSTPCVYNRNSRSSVVGRITATKGSKSATCFCSSPKYCVKTTKTCTWRLGTSTVSYGSCSTEGATRKKDSTTTYVCRCTSSSSNVEC